MTDKLKEIINADSVRENESLAKYTTFKTGGAARLFIEPKTVDELKKTIKFLHKAKMPWYILGNGSNLLVSDRGVSRAVIHIGKMISDVSVFENCLTVRAGATLSLAAQTALKHSLSGLEFAAGIPGTFGGAVIMNAGAYGSEMKDIVEAVAYIDPTGEERVAQTDEMEFSYRSSALQNTNCTVIGGTLCLKKGNPDQISEKMKELAMRRREKQPLEYPSAGSTFKRPKGHFAAALIEQCGLKGKEIGGARVSEKHAGFIVNTGNASTEDILRLIEFVKETVYNKTGISLEPEIKYWE